MSWTDDRAGVLRKIFGFLVFAGVAVAGSVALAAADQVPQFNVEPGCRAAAIRAGAPDYTAICVQKEQNARRTLAQSWPQFKPAHRAQCLQRARLGGQGTFTELLTCLETARDAEAARHPRVPVTTGGVSR